MDHFIVVAKLPKNRSEAAGVPVVIQIFVLFLFYCRLTIIILLE